MIQKSFKYTEQLRRQMPNSLKIKTGSNFRNSYRTNLWTIEHKEQNL